MLCVQLAAAAAQAEVTELKSRLKEARVLVPPLTRYFYRGFYTERGESSDGWRVCARQERSPRVRSRFPQHVGVAGMSRARVIARLGASSYSDAGSVAGDPRWHCSWGPGRRRS
jgi:hypothetical protein